jgi:hypothetical protein
MAAAMIPVRRGNIKSKSSGWFGGIFKLPRRHEGTKKKRRN